MAFIKTEKLDLAASNPADIAFSSLQSEQGVICKSPKKLQALLEVIQPNRSVHYISRGDWSMHDLVMQLVKRSSPAEIFMTTYALRETPIRQLVLAQQNGLISGLHMIIDYRAKIRTPEVYQLAKQNANRICQLAIHAKVCVIKSEQQMSSIVTSSNWTTNPKIEAGVVTMDPGVGEFHINWINQTIESADIFK